MNIAFICTDDDSLSFGMRSVSAVVKTYGYKSRLIFMETGEKTFSQNTLEELITLIHDYDVIGFSCLAGGSNKAKQVLEYLKPLKKTSIWGGVHASLDPEDCANWADYVCIGEGEGMIVELMDSLKNGRDCRDILNVAYKENGTLIINDLRPLIINLDDLLLPDFSFENEYHLTKGVFKRIFELYNVERNGQIAFTGSRGCAFFCTYCCNIKLKNLYLGKEHYVRRMSVGRLIEHSQKLREIFPNGKYFYFIDEDFAARPIRELVELAERFPKEVGLPFECLAHPARITEQTLDLLVKAGLFRIRIGIETGSERTKKEIYNRRVSNEVVFRATDILGKSLQVDPVYFFIFGNPYENREDLLATLHLIADLPIGSNIQAFELTFFPGSALFERAKQDGIIKGYSDSGYDLNFFGALHYKEYPWKKKNLYLNAIIFLSGGLCTRYRIGIIPRFMFNFLMDRRIEDFNEKHTFAIRISIHMKEFLWVARSRVAQLLKRIINDPYAIYNPRFFIMKKLSFIKMHSDKLFH